MVFKMRSNLKRISRLVLFVVLGLCVLTEFVYVKPQGGSPFDEPPRKPRPFTVDDIPKLESTASKLRELKFKNKVKVGIKNKKELKQKMLESYEKDKGDKEYIKIQKSLVKFGLIPNNTDLSKLMLDIYTEQIGGFYDPEEKELFVIKPDEDEKLPPEAEIMERIYGPSAYYKMTTVHELTHALQDQNFDLTTLPMNSMDNDDVATAVQSLVEGEATYVMYDYLMHLQGMDLSLIPMPDNNGKEFSIEDDNSILNQSPAYIRESLMFPYDKGLRFVHNIKSEKGWGFMDKMYKELLPESTEQIIHPEKYLSEPKDYPITIELPDLSKLFPQEQYEKLLQNVSGELTIDILIKEYLHTIKNEEIGAGWGGDKYIIFERKAPAVSPDLGDKIKSIIAKLKSKDSAEQKQAEQDLIKAGTSALPLLQEIKTKAEYQEIKLCTNRLIDKIQNNSIVLVWFLNWDTQKDADEFYDAYFALLNKKYDDAKNIEKSGPGDIMKTVWRNSGKELLTLLEKRKCDTLVIETAPEKILPELASLIWKEVKKESLKEIKRIQPEKKKDKNTSGEDKKKEEKK
jgi:hypothetical protein